MELGTNQAITYSVEATHGVAVTPAYNLGIVMSGQLQENAGVGQEAGVESKVALNQLYKESTCGGNSSILLKDLSLLNWGMARTTQVSSLMSRTLDCGLFHNAFRRRMVGCKVDSLRLGFDISSPLKVDLSWIGIYTVDAEVESNPPGNDTYPIWVPQGMSVTYGGLAQTDLQSLEVSINNNLKRRFLASSQTRFADCARHCFFIDEGVQQIEATITTLNRLPVGVRGLTPVDGLWDGFDIVIAMDDLCSSETANITLHHCYQQELVEDLVPNDSIEYTSRLSVGSITWTQTYTEGIS